MIIQKEQGKTGQSYGRRDNVRDKKEGEGGSTEKLYNAGWGSEGGGEGGRWACGVPIWENRADVI